MSRNLVLATGVICWALVVGDVIIHLLGGNVFVPIAMAIAGVVWIGLRRLELRLKESLATRD